MHEHPRFTESKKGKPGMDKQRSSFWTVPTNNPVTRGIYGASRFSGCNGMP